MMTNKIPKMTVKSTLNLKNLSKKQVKLLKKNKRKAQVLSFRNAKGNRPMKDSRK